MYSDRYTPVEVMRILRKESRHCYLLESAGQTEQWGRYSFLGYDSSMEITCTDGKMRIRKTSLGGWSEEELRTVNHPGQVLREIIDENRTPELPGLPTFTGGLVGYFSYDYIKYSEPKIRLSDEEKTDFRDMDLMLFDNVIAFDHYRQKIYLITGVRSADLEQSYEKAEAKLNEIEKLLKTGEKMEFPPIQLKTEIKPQFSEGKYEEMVEKAKHYIREGDVFQVVLSNPMRAKAEGSLFDTYRVLRTHNPSPYMFYFSSDDIEIAGASPETLVKLEGRKVSTFPLAGTRPRGKDAQEDKRLYDIGRAKYVPVTDDEAVDAFEYLSRIEGIIPAIESAHAVAYAKKIVPQMSKDEIVVITLSGRGDKDCAAIARYRGEDIHE